MNRRAISLVLAGGVVLGGLSGCCGTAASRSGYPPVARPAVAPPCDRCGGPGPLPPRFNPGPVPVAPAPAAPAVVSPPAAEIQQNNFLAPAPPAPAVAPAGGRAAPGVYLAPPEPATPPPSQPPAPTNPGTPPRESARLYAPQTAEPPPAPPGKDDRAASPALPVDIPQFAVAKPNVASGQEPYPEGVTWLKAHGYRTVLHVRAPGEDGAADRKRFEQAGLRYLSLEVSPQTLSKEIVDQFNRAVGDANNLPLFVYDRDGSLAGGLWYLHFRLADRVSDEKARADAAQLGFRQDQEGPHRTMWVAVQNLLQNLNP